MNVLLKFYVEYIYLGSGISFIFFLGFLIRYRKRKLLNKITPLQKVYENASMLKNEIESMVKSKVKISTMPVIKTCLAVLYLYIQVGKYDF